MTDRSEVPDGDDSRINRRSYVAALSAASAGLLAGCQSGPSGEDTDTPGGGGGDGGDGDGGDGGDGGTELGERVPTVQLRIWGGIGDSTEEYLAGAPIVQQGAESALGINTNIRPIDIGTVLGNVDNDESRDIHAHYGGSAISPFDLDPFAGLREFHIRHAGNSPATTNTHYAGPNVCEISRLIEELQVVSSPDRQREITHRIMQLGSEDITFIPINNRIFFGAIRTDQLDPPEVARAGMLKSNPEFYLNVEPKQEGVGLRLPTQREVLQIANPIVTGNTSSRYMWNHYFFSPLTRFDENWEIKNVLATSEEVTNEFQTITYEIREDAVFHDGEPITAEDVQWTFQYMADNSADLPNVTPWPYESIDVVDEHTVQFNFTQPTPSWIKRDAPYYGILPKHTWIEHGAEETDNPASFQVPAEDYNGSGPYELTQYTSGQIAAGEPFEDHWNTPSLPMSMELFTDVQAAQRAFNQGDINTWIGLPAESVEPLQENENAQVVPTNGFVTHGFWPLMSYGPFKHREFRMAFSQTIDRQQIVEVAKFGFGHPVVHAGNQFSYEWPFYPENPDETMTRIAETERANPEAAKQVLEDAGWGWDDNDRLHYPADADLEPLWEPGESPLDYPERWPCVTELEMGERLPVDDSNEGE